MGQQAIKLQRQPFLAAEGRSLVQVGVVEQLAAAQAGRQRWAFRGQEDSATWQRSVGQRF
jgi:hypothetical protein